MLGIAPRAWVNCSLSPRIIITALSITTDATRAPPCCSACGVMIGARRWSNASGWRSPCHEAPRLRNDQRVRSPGRNVHPLIRPRPSEVSTNPGAHRVASTTMFGRNGSVPVSSEATITAMKPARRRPDSGRTDEATTARRWPRRSWLTRRIPPSPKIIVRDARACSTRSSYTASCEWITWRTSTGWPVAATTFQPSVIRSSDQCACASSGSSSPTSTLSTAARRISAPESVKIAEPRAPRAGFNVSRSKVSSWRPLGPCSAESSSAMRDWPITTATLSSSIDGSNEWMALGLGNVAGVEQEEDRCVRGRIARLETVVVFEIRCCIHSAELCSDRRHLGSSSEVDDDVSVGRHRTQREHGGADMVDRLLADSHHDVDPGRVDATGDVVLVDRRLRAVPHRPGQDGGADEPGDLDDECKCDQPDRWRARQRRHTPCQVRGGGRQTEARDPASDCVRPSVHLAVLAYLDLVVRLVINGIGTLGWGLECAVVTCRRCRDSCLCCGLGRR